MPSHSGAKFYRDLKKDKKLSKIPVLIVTGHARDELGKADFNEMTMSGPGFIWRNRCGPTLMFRPFAACWGSKSPQLERTTRKDFAASRPPRFRQPTRTRCNAHWMRSKRNEVSIMTEQRKDSRRR